MRFKFSMLFAVLVAINQLSAQTKKPISVGDSLPDFIIPKIVRWPEKDVKTSDFKDKLLIIDFWATHCGSCVEAMSHLQTIQKHYGSKIMILPVTDQETGHIKDFMKNNVFFKNVTLPSVVEDKMFRQLFPYRSIPHEIWVYKGKVIGITLGSYVNKSHIDDVLAGRPTNLPFKYDFYKFDITKPIFNMDTAMVRSKTKKTSYAAISGFKYGVNSDGVFAGSGLVRNKDDQTIRFYFINESIFQLYLILFKKISLEDARIPNTLPLNNVVWEVANRSRYRFQSELGIKYDWSMSNAVCFEFVQPDTGQNDIEVYRMAIKDLNSLLGLNVRWEKRNEKVLVARNKNVKDAIKHKSNIDNPYVVPVSELIWHWNHIEDRTYLFNETVGINDVKVDFMEDEANNISIMKDKLSLCGIALISENREVDKLVFSEIGKVNNSH